MRLCDVVFLPVLFAPTIIELRCPIKMLRRVNQIIRSGCAPQFVVSLSSSLFADGVKYPLRSASFPCIANIYLRIVLA